MKIRIPVDSTLLQRDAIVNKDSLLTNTFIDKEANQFEYLTKRPGFLLGIGGVTNGINYGIYINPNTGDFYYIGGNGTPILGTPPNYWNKDTNYSIGIIVIYKGRLYTALTNNINSVPTNTVDWSSGLEVGPYKNYTFTWTTAGEPFIHATVTEQSPLQLSSLSFGYEFVTNSADFIYFEISTPFTYNYVLITDFGVNALPTKTSGVLKVILSGGFYNCYYDNVIIYQHPEVDTNIWGTAPTLLYNTIVNGPFGSGVNFSNVVFI